MSKFGAFASGLVSGYATGQRLNIERERADRDKERDRRDTERHSWERDKITGQRQAWQELAGLVDEYLNPQPPAATAHSARTGIKALMAGADASPSGPISLAMPGVGVPAPRSTEAAAAPSERPVSAGNEDQISIAVEQAAAKQKLSPEETQQLREQVGERLNSERIGVGLFRNPNLFKDPQFLSRAGQIFTRAGMPEGVKWLERGAQAVEEHGFDALRRLIGGDARGAEQAFNQGGGMRVVPGATREVGNGRWEITLEGGQKQVIDPRQMLRSFLKPAEFFNLEVKEREATSKEQSRLDTAAHRGRELTERERHNRATEGIQKQLVAIRAERGRETETAMIKNIDFLVSRGIAKDAADAFGKLRTAMEKPEEDAILSMAGTLMRGPGYGGRDGWNRALQTATGMVRSVKSQASGGDAGEAGTPAPAGRSYNVKGKTFTDADIKATAQKYGITEDQVKQRLGIK